MPAPLRVRAFPITFLVRTVPYYQPGDYLLLRAGKASVKESEARGPRPPGRRKTRGGGRIVRYRGIL